MFAINADTHEVYEQCPDKHWKERLEAWIKCSRARKCSYHATAMPSPMPWGHVMFDKRRKNGYTPCKAAPTPVWSDGAGCVYEGQRVGWTGIPNFPGGYPNWMYGRVIGLEDGLLLIRRDDGGICTVAPYNLA